MGDGVENLADYYSKQDDDYKNINNAIHIGAIDSNYSWTPGIDWTPLESFDFTTYII